MVSLGFIWVGDSFIHRAAGFDFFQVIIKKTDHSLNKFAPKNWFLKYIIVWSVSECNDFVLTIQCIEIL